MKYMLLLYRDENIHGRQASGEHSAPYMAYTQADRRRRACGWRPPATGDDGIDSASGQRQGERA